MSTPAKDPRPAPASILTGELTPGEVDEVLERAASDPDASAELDLTADLVAALQIPDRSALAPRLLLLATALAASLALWVGLRPPPTAPGFGVSPPAYVPLVERSDGEGDPFHEAMQPYAQGRHADAVSALSAFLSERGDHRPARFYRAVSLVELGRLEDARSDLERVAGDERDFLGDHARFRLALVLLRLDEGAHAGRLLRSLADAGGELAPNARSVLEEIGGDGR